MTKYRIRKITHDWPFRVEYYKVFINICGFIKLGYWKYIDAEKSLEDAKKTLHRVINNYEYHNGIVYEYNN